MGGEGSVSQTKELPFGKALGFQEERESNPPLMKSHVGTHVKDGQKKQKRQTFKLL